MNYLNKTQIEKIVAIALEAGKIVLEKQNQNLNITKKPDNSEVTDADIAVSNFISDNLQKNFPDIAIICEEKKLRDFSDDIFFLIDPIDGTSSYIKGSDEFSVNIGLIKNNKPVFGLIYAPKFEGGKIIYQNENNEIILNDKIIEPKKSDPSNIKIITSKRKDFGNVDKFVEHFYTNKKIEISRMSSAVKFIPLLEGKVDLILSFRDTMEWDIAAGHAIVNASGGFLKEILVKNNLLEISKDMIYKKKDFVNNFFICSN